MGDRRIEPTFGGSASDEGSSLFVSEADRVVGQRGKRGSAKTSSSRKAAPKTRGQGTGKKRGRQRRSGGGGLFGFLRKTTYWSFVLAIWGGVAAAGVLVFYAAQMPSASTWAIPDRPPNVKIMDIEGRQVANRGMMGGESIGLHEMSPYIPQAVVAIEDRRFYSHFGVDPQGLARAMYENIVNRRVVQGGSTLTQQLAKNLFLTNERSYDRKIREVLMAFWLEHEHSKDQILEMYLNRVYFGSGAYGVEAASRRYFGKSARDVTLSEASMLAGLLVAPSRLSPARDPQAAENRAQLVLSAMRDQGMIGDSELASAISAPPVRAAAYWTGSENYVADRIMGELPGLIGGDVRKDLIVEATIDLDLQELGEQAIRQMVDENKSSHDVSQGALVSIDGNGAVRAMVGGYDYANSQFDRASEARRQPGSAFKSFVWMAAMEQGLFPDTIRNDAPVKIGNWSPQNFNNTYSGPMTLSQALARSSNTIAAVLAHEVGPSAIVEGAWRMGIESDLQPNLSISLGTSEVTPLELTAAYVPFSTGGIRPDIHFVERVSTIDGEVLYQRPASAGIQVATPEIVGMMNYMMAETVGTGTGRNADFGWPAAGKTGTSQNSRDAWFVGYTAALTTGVWFGNDDGKPMKNITGGQLPAKAWKIFMEGAHEGLAVANLPGRWTPDTFQRIEDLLASDRGIPQQDAYPQQDSGTTGSIQPPGDVGGEQQARQQRQGPIGSIMDIIMGN
ncbi:PBP1A family penicillin-binding protein [Aliihoeflea aestuarii]|jgi:penicillin-binding protein 1A|uniref:transglycosylase domain-containing protein n=1 Tax=Aliihoeflea aestuarii TaxID=453840 RepID=UPI002094F629|nr:transglycosylase domain-containing protein [Aliihoeflea aestuarii]MCO6392942.1 PBP1A family penicillin-binding protein [Aliihoeflea aestuarii]